MGAREKANFRSDIKRLILFYLNEVLRRATNMAQEHGTPAVGTAVEACLSDTFQPGPLRPVNA